MDQHDDPAWLYHMGRMFRRFAKEAKTPIGRENCERLGREFFEKATMKETTHDPR